MILQALTVVKIETIILLFDDFCQQYQLSDHGTFLLTILTTLRAVYTLKYHYLRTVQSGMSSESRFDPLTIGEEVSFFQSGSASNDQIQSAL